MKTPIQSLSRSKGAVLAVGLMLLLVISMTAVFALSGAVMQERMVGAVRNESIADNGTESALRDGERSIWQGFVSARRDLRPDGTSFVTVPESSIAGGPVRTFRTSLDWVNMGQPYGGNGTPGNNPISSTDYHSMARVPRFLVESIGADDPGSLWNPETHRDGGAADGTGGSPGKLHYYRVTARSTGGTDGVIRASESTFTATY